MAQQSTYASAPDQDDDSSANSATYLLSSLRTESFAVDGVERSSVGWTGGRRYVPRHCSMEFDVMYHGVGGQGTAAC